MEDIGLKFIYNNVVNTKAVTVFWFFPNLFCAYLSMPLLAAIEKSKRLSVFTYAAVTGFLLNVVIPFFKSTIFTELSFPLSVIVVAYPVIYLVVGYLLSHYDCTPKWCMGIYISAAVALVVHMAGTYILSVNANTVVKTFKHLIVALPYASGIFCFFKSYGNKIMDTAAGKAVNYLKKYTFSIYLLHWFVMKLFLVLYPFDTTKLIYQLGMPLIIVPVCIVITEIMRRIPVVKYIVPQ